MPLIYRKTAKGLAEISTREHRLAPRVRSTLILVDGRRDAADLRALIAQQADETLAALAEQGFIEAVGETAAAPVPAPVPAPLEKPASSPPAHTLEALRRLAVRGLTDNCGPAAETLAIRIERAGSVDELRPLFTQAIGLVQSMRGRSAAEAFAARLPPF